MKARSWTLLFLLFLLSRCYQLSIPFVEPFNSISRQGICAQVARNFYEHGFRILQPEIDTNGNGSSLYNAEMPLYSYLMALGYAIKGSPDEWVARSVSVLFSLLFLYALLGVLKRIERGPGLAVAVVFAASTPLSLGMSRSIQPDMPMLAGMMAALYWAFQYKDSNRLFDLGASACFLLLAALTKIFAFMIAPVLLWIFWEKERGDLFRRKRYGAFLVCVSCALIWYAWMWVAGKTQDLGFEPYVLYRNAGYLDPHKIFSVVKVLLLHHLTLPGVFLVFIGSKQDASDRIPRWFWLWGTMLLIYSTLFWPYIAKHAYYQLPWLPWFAILICRGWRRAHPNKVLSVALTIVFGLHLYYYYPKIYSVPDKMQANVGLCRELDRSLPKDALVLVAAGSIPAQVYYMHRKGWGLDPEIPDGPEIISRVEKFMHQGADYFVCLDDKWLVTRPHLAEYLSEHADPLHISDNVVLYRLAD